MSAIANEVSDLKTLNEIALTLNQAADVKTALGTALAKLVTLMQLETAVSDHLHRYPESDANALIAAVLAAMADSTSDLPPHDNTTICIIKREGTAHAG